MKKTIAALAFVSANAFAATSTITATGNISSSCSFGSVNAGTLAVSPSQPDIITTAPASGGQAATFMISYLGTPSVTMDKPTAFDNEPSAASSLNKTFGMQVQSVNKGVIVPSGSTFTIAETSGSSDTITVNLTAGFDNNTPVPFGSYGISTIATCQ